MDGIPASRIGRTYKDLPSYEVNKVNLEKNNLNPDYDEWEDEADVDGPATDIATVNINDIFRTDSIEVQLRYTFNPSGVSTGTAGAWCDAFYGNSILDCRVADVTSAYATGAHEWSYMYRWWYVRSSSIEFEIVNADSEVCGMAFVVPRDSIITATEVASSQLRVTDYPYCKWGLLGYMGSSHDHRKFVCRMTTDKILGRDTKVCSTKFIGRNNSSGLPILVPEDPWYWNVGYLTSGPSFSATSTDIVVRITYDVVFRVRQTVGVS